MQFQPLESSENLHKRYIDNAAISVEKVPTIGKWYLCSHDATSREKSVDPLTGLNFDAFY